ncbi:MAG: hypothetical protein HYT37_01435 [Candidatus Sungbacteria bacterium]|nr:hypothetical protein [Candidatus Sungbacteria bacterium]
MKHYFVQKKKGITLLLVIVILSALLSISIGIFNVVYGEILISGEIADSYTAFYASDRAIDKFLYLDRMTPQKLGNNATEDTTGNPSSTGCFVVEMYKTPASIFANCNNTTAIACIRSVGQPRCGANTARNVKRGFMVTY